MLNSTFVTISPSHDPEPQESVESKVDQHEFTKIHADQCVQDIINSPREIEDILGSKVTCPITENGQRLDPCISDNLDGAVVSRTNLHVEKKIGDVLKKEMAFQEDKMPSEENFEAEEDEVGNSFSEKTLEFLADAGEKGDGELPSEMNCYGNNSLESQPEPSLKVNSLSSHVDAFLPEDKCMVLTEETELIRKESESEEDRHDHHPNHSSEKSIRESDIDKENTSKTDSLIGTNCKNNEKETLVITSLDRASDRICQVEEEKAVDHGYHIDLCNDKQNEVSEENCKESKGESLMVPGLEMLPAVLSFLNGSSNEEEPRDCKTEDEEPAEKQLGEEMEEKPDASCVTGKGTEEKESGELHVSQSLPVQAETYLPCFPASLLQSQDNQQNTVMGSEDAYGSSESTLELKPENYDELFVTAASNFHARSLTVETLVSPIELAMEKPQHEASYNVTEAQEIVMETKSSASANQPIKQHEKLETSQFAKDGYKAQQSMGRLSTESNPDNLNIQAQMQKSPSFDLDLRVEERSEESDQTPLLYQDKTTIDSLSSQADVSLLNSLLHDQHVKQSLEHQAMPVEKKMITLERSDSEKSRTPFLGFLKEDEEAHVAVTPNKQDNLAAEKKATKDLWNSPSKEVGSTLPKGKQKHKRRTSLFGNCMCCASVIN